jgi:uncharacterized protein (DUF433 family)
MAVIDWSECPVVESIPGKVSGAWVLKGTRMPVSAIFENLEAGANIDDIMVWFDGLDRDQVRAVIEFAARSLDSPPLTPRKMLVLFDQGIPLPLPPYLVGHSVRTAAQQGWATLGNGDLLKVAEEADFDVLFTTDKNIRYPAESFRSEDRNRGTGAAAMASTSSPCPTRRRYYSGSHARQLCRSRKPIGIEISVTPTVRTARAARTCRKLTGVPVPPG